MARQAPYEIEEFFPCGCVWLCFIFLALRVGRPGKYNPRRPPSRSHIRVFFSPRLKTVDNGGGSAADFGLNAWSPRFPGALRHSCSLKTSHPHSPEWRKHSLPNMDFQTVVTAPLARRWELRVPRCPASFTLTQIQPPIFPGVA